MTGLPDPLPARRPLRATLRWTASFVAVAAVHVGGAAAIMALQIEPPPATPPLAAVMIDLAPLPSAPTVQSAATEPQPETPPEPEPEPEPEPPPPEPPPPEPPPPEPPPPEPEPPPPEPPPEPPPPPPEVEPEVSIEEPPPPPPKPTPPPKPQTPQKPKEPVREVKRPKPAPAPSSAPAVPLPAAPTAAAPMQSAPSDRPSQAVPKWRDRLLGHLERHKRYPRSAQVRRQEGVAYVRFTIDRQGTVLSVRLDRPSGHRLLDQETVDLVQRASPLPAPPEEFTDDRIELVVPVQFFLR